MNGKISTAIATAAGAVVLVAASPANAAVGNGLNSTGGGVTVDAKAQPRNVDARAAVGFRISNASCTSTSVKFRAKTYETGRSGVRQFVQKAQLQKYTTGGWVNATGVRKVASQRFPNDSRNFAFTRVWTGTHSANGGSWRVKWQGVYKNGGGATIAKTRVITVTCR